MPILLFVFSFDAPVFSLDERFRGKISPGDLK